MPAKKTAAKKSATKPKTKKPAGKKIVKAILKNRKAKKPATEKSGKTENLFEKTGRQTRRRNPKITAAIETNVMRKVEGVTLEEFDAAAATVLRFARESGAGIAELIFRDADEKPVAAIVATTGPDSTVPLIEVSEKIKAEIEKEDEELFG